MLVRLVLAATVAYAGLVIQPEVASAQSPAQSFAYRQQRFRNTCRPPLKFAAGACVRQCPAGYRNDGGYCRYLSQRQR